mmetsp:Transcript_74220/g.170068  ORF Transcript_74220/g.170068 Transcript_74220/m.170068 type:complete len:83 (-) Transcript_74220:105-353(-)
MGISTRAVFAPSTAHKDDIYTDHSQQPLQLYYSLSFEFVCGTGNNTIDHLDEELHVACGLTDTATSKKLQTQTPPLDKKTDQ